MADSVGILEITVQKSSDASTFNLKDLKEEIKKLKAETKGGIKGLTKAAKDLDILNKAINKFPVDKIKKISDTLSELKGLGTLDIGIKGKSSDKSLDKVLDKVKNFKSPKTDLSDTTTVSDETINKVSRLSDFIERLKTSANGAKDVMTKLLGKTKELGSSSKDTSTQFKKLGSSLKNTSKHFKKFLSSIGRVVFYRAIRAAIRGVTQAIGEGTKNLYQWSKLQKDIEGNTFAKSMDKASSSFLYFKNAIGTALAPIINGVVPVFEKFINTVVEGINWLSRSLAILRNDDYWLKAKYQVSEYAAAEGEATDNAKELKRTLIGLDELNVLPSTSDSSQSSKNLTNYDDMFEKVKLDKNSQEFQKYFDEAVSGLLIGGLALFAAGAVIAFSGTNIPLGIGMMATGAAEIYKAAKMSDGLSDDIKKKLATLGVAVGEAYLTLGAILAFSGANIPLGIGLIALGAVGLATAVKMSDGLSPEMTKTITLISGIVGGASLVVGAILAFSGANIPLGIGLMLAGAAGIGTAVAINWDFLKEKFMLAWDAIAEWAKSVPNKVKIFFFNLKADIGNAVIDIINLIARPFTGDENFVPDNVQYVKMSYELDYDEQKAKIGNDDVLGNFLKQKALEFTVSAIFKLDEAKSTAKNFITNIWNKITNKDTKLTATGEEKGSKPSSIWASIKNIFSKDGKKAKTGIETSEKGTKVSSIWSSISNIFGKNGKTSGVNVKGTESGKKVTSLWDSIRYIFGKNKKTSSVVVSGTDKSGKLEQLKQTLAFVFGKDKKEVEIVAKLKDSLSQGVYALIFNIYKAINSFIKAVNEKFKTKISLLKSPVVAGPTTDGKSMNYYWKGFASGGHPDKADFFYANENGIPEMVGKIGNQPTVATNADIVAAVSQGVASAVSSTIGNSNGTFNVNVYLDSEQVYSSVVKQNRQNTIRTGRNALAY